MCLVHFLCLERSFYEISKWNWLKSRAEYAHEYVFWNENKIVGIGGITSFWGSPTESIHDASFKMEQKNSDKIKEWLK